MNILEAFETSIPEITAHRKVPPKLEPRLIAREHIEEGKPVVMIHLPGSDGLYRMSPQQWHIYQLMDGQRSYADIAQACQEEGYPYSEEDVRDLVEQSRESDLLYKTPAERNITLKQKTASQRQRIRKLKFGNLSEIEIAHWDPDEFLTRLYPKVRFVYTPWFVFLTLIGFVVMLFLCLDRWSMLWHDSLKFFNYFNKGPADLIEFYFLFGMMICMHETAHGMTCKHFGGGVRRMGFMLMYLMPTFFCDLTEAWIYTGRWPRIATMIAGVWADLIVCVPATVVWWATPEGMPMHDFAYKIMLLTGIVISLLQLNPLIKLDGYFIFSELIQIANLKEASSACLSTWVERNIFRLPVEVEYVPRGRRAFYFTYAVLAEVYGIALLLVFVTLGYNILRSFSPQWGFIPAFFLGYLIFKSKVLSFMRLLKLSYLDHKERWKQHFFSWRAAAAVSAAMLALVLPVWRETVEGRLVLQPVKRAILHASVPGQVQEVLAAEGQQVERGATLVRLANLELQTQAAETRLRLQAASARAIQSRLNYTDLATADRERDQLVQQSRTITEQLKDLEVVSPITGVVLTPRMQDLAGRYLLAGAEIVEVADFSAMRARVFVPEFTMRDVRVGAPVRLLPQGALRSLPGTVISISPAAAPLPDALMETSEYSGIRPPQYYMAMVSFTPPAVLPEGLTGTAKIFVRRRSLARFTWEFLRDMTQRKFW
ncbi:MAG: HlyD family efflux transporter periplasmic adaptor subunit [Terriglobales bacterium]